MVDSGTAVQNDNDIKLNSGQNNKRVVLIRPNHTNDKRNYYVTFPAGLGYIAAVLRKNGYEISIFDLTLIDVDYDALAAEIKEIQPAIIGISSMSHEFSPVRRLTRFLKDTVACPIILGGTLASYNYDIILKKTDVDICVIGEGEDTIVDLVTHLGSIQDVHGIAYKQDGEVKVTPPRAFIADLDSIPYPAYDLFDMSRYAELLMRDIYVSQKNLKKRKVHRRMNLEASRGCPFNCDFCSNMFHKVRRRKVENVIDEIKFLKDNYGVDIFGFHDDLFFVNKEHVRSFCAQIKELDVNWYALLRVDTIDKDLLPVMKDSGCLTISFGVESGSATILKNMNKRVKPEQIEKTISTVLDSGMPVDMSLILGYPGENKKTVNETIDLLKRIGYPGMRFRYITPYPGSPLYDRCIREGIIPDEERYLESLSDGTGPYRFRINFTEFSDDDLTDVLPETINTVLRNYLMYLLKNPRKLFRYMWHKDVMNPFYYYYNRWFYPTNYDKAAKRKQKRKVLAG